MSTDNQVAVEAPGRAPDSAFKSAVKNFVSGGFGGVCLILAGHPFDLIKVRIQTQIPGPDGKLPYTGAIDCVKKTLAREGPRALYKGMSAPLGGVVPIFSLCFLSYDAAKSFIKTSYNFTSDKQLSLFQIGVAGAASAIPTTAIMAPGERIKCILQVQDSQPHLFPRRFTGPGDVIGYLRQTAGVQSVFRGAAATLLRDGSGSFAYFSVYEWIKRSLTPEGQTSMSPLAVVLGGGFAGVANWLVALPFDVIKSKIQVETGADKRKSIASVGRELLAQEGIAGLYRGAGPALLRAFPANAACFLGMEMSMQLLNKAW